MVGLLLALTAMADLSIQAAAKELGVYPGTIHRWLATGQLRGYRMGERVIRIRTEDIEAAKRPAGNGVA
jgi:excisionase family DNA binding protein